MSSYDRYYNFLKFHPHFFADGSLFTADSWFPLLKNLPAFSTRAQGWAGREDKSPKITRVRPFNTLSKLAPYENSRLSSEPAGGPAGHSVRGRRRGGRFGAVFRAATIAAQSAWR